MTRVDQALRRASEDLAPYKDGVADLSQAPFPVELIEQQHSAPSSEPPAATSSAPASSDDSSAKTLLEHVDVQLAGKTVVDQSISPVSREQYRRLAAGLHHQSELTGLKVVMVTSAAVGEGKTLTATNLALTLSESYKKKVLLVDADLRRPAVQKIFCLDDGPGLSDGLIAKTDRKMTVHRISSLLSVMTAGRPTADPIAGLTSDRMRRVLDEARDTFEWIIIDTPPVVLLPDANLLGAMVDGAILVIRANGPSYQLVQRAVDAIGRDKIVGTVLNRATSTSRHGDHDYYEYYAYSADAKASTVASS